MFSNFQWLTKYRRPLAATLSSLAERNASWAMWWYRWWISASALKESQHSVAAKVDLRYRVRSRWANRSSWIYYKLAPNYHIRRTFRISCQCYLIHMPIFGRRWVIQCDANVSLRQLDVLTLIIFFFCFQTHKQPVTEYEAIREKAANQKRDIEKALTKFLAKTSETYNLFSSEDPNNQPYPCKFCRI